MFRLITLALACFISTTVFAGNGLVKLKSNHSVEQTLNRFEQAVMAKGMTVFTRIDHTAGAAGVDMSLAPLQVLIFGNPKIGTLLMQSQPTTGIDLPLKVLAWQDSQGQVWLAYNDPAYLTNRHQITDRDPVVAKMQKALENFARAAVK